MSNSTTNSAPVFHTARRSGKTVVMGSPDVVKPGKLMVDGREVTIEGTGSPFTRRGETMVYGYIADDASAAPTESGDVATLKAKIAELTEALANAEALIAQLNPVADAAQ